MQSALDGIMRAKRIPIDRIEQRIAGHALKIAAFQDLKSLARGLRDAVDRLRGVPSFDGSKDMFAAKQAFATSSRTDSQAPSDPAGLGVSVTNAAQATSHTVEVLQLGTAHKVASASISGGLTATLGLSGSFEINGRTITVEATHSLLDLRDRINAANSGSGATGVTASIVSLSSSEHVLILTAAKTGAAAAIAAADSRGGILQRVPPPPAAQSPSEICLGPTSMRAAAERPPPATGMLDNRTILDLTAGCSSSARFLYQAPEPRDRRYGSPTPTVVGRAPGVARRAQESAPASGVREQYGQ
ncbi:MAG TPA: flagellar cap protein FliD N-terminal domain-containing protein [Geminicoccaceae bacterium]|nr:flagellar cap protein FliD N-terminal domain-containing protein [Geminicoccaceae bacterium]